MAMTKCNLQPVQYRAPRLLTRYWVPPRSGVPHIATPRSGVLHIATPQSGVLHIATPQSGVLHIATPQSGVPHIVTPQSGVPNSVVVVGVFLWVCLLVGCQQNTPAERPPTDAPAQHLAAETTGSAAVVASQGVGLSDKQREVLQRVRGAGGDMDGEGEVVPTLIDLASDRVFADDALVRSMAEFPELRRLRLAVANTTPDAFHALESLQQLTELYLQGAPLTDQDLIRIVEAIPTLERLTLRRLNGVTDAIIPALTNCPRLKMLALIEMNSVSGETLTEIKSIASLRALDLRHCGKLAGDDFKHLMQLDQLVELKLGGPAINDEVLSVVAQHPSISSLTVEDAEVSAQCLQRLVAEPAFATRLRTLSFARCFGISDEALSALDQFPQLESLVLRNIFVTGAFLAPLRETKPQPAPLKTLIVTSGFLADDAIACLPDLFPELTRLDLRGNAGISDASLAVFGKLTALRELHLEETGVSDPAAWRSP